MKLFECQQGTPEWLQARVGKITASNFRDARTKTKSGEFSAKAKDYAFQIAAERIAGELIDNGQFVTWQMLRGNELEPDARAAHAYHIGKDIKQAGFVYSDDEKFGASADGIIGKDGGAEYKCLIGAASLRAVIIDHDIGKYEDQIQGCMWLTGRAWWHFVLYCPALSPAGRDLTIIRCERNDAYILQLDKDLAEFDALVEEYKAEIENGDIDQTIGQVAKAAPKPKAAAKVEPKHEWK